mmetsp:Transcript_7164/g.15572  ORF Transcript_7164/g.15572 Transcript_7164/m.15572 type:complete len:269 (+) Transcript_7164:166-972(+)
MRQEENHHSCSAPKHFVQGNSEEVGPRCRVNVARAHTVSSCNPQCNGWVELSTRNRPDREGSSSDARAYCHAKLEILPRKRCRRSRRSNREDDEGQKTSEGKLSPEDVAPEHLVVLHNWVQSERFTRVGSSEVNRRIDDTSQHTRKELDEDEIRGATSRTFVPTRQKHRERHSRIEVGTRHVANAVDQARQRRCSRPGCDRRFSHNVQAHSQHEHESPDELAEEHGSNRRNIVRPDLREAFLRPAGREEDSTSKRPHQLKEDVGEHPW